MPDRIKDNLLCTYKKSHNPGIVPYIFGVPFTIGCAIFWVLAIVCGFAHGEVAIGLGFLFGGAIFMLIAYGFGWWILAHYIKICRVIKEERYVTVRAECKSKTISRETRYHDSTHEEDRSTLIFENEGQKYILNDWGSFRQIETNTEYLLIFFDTNNKINAIFNKETSKMVYLE